MIKRGEARFEVDGREYVLSLLRNHDPANDRDILTTSVDPRGGGPSTLGAVLSAFWRNRPKDVLDSIETRVGLACDGAVSYSFQEEDPERSPPGVTAHEFERSETVTVPFFARFAAEFGLAYMTAAAEAGIGAHEDLKPALLALRARFAKNGE